ncbi:hypothetical protein ACJJTC_013834 [Scirpophaga incertulas]
MKVRLRLHQVGRGPRAVQPRGGLRRDREGRHVAEHQRQAPLHHLHEGTAAASSLLVCSWLYCDMECSGAFEWEYEHKSLEELRLEDYQAGRKGAAAPMFGGFAAQTENKPLFPTGK